jgi:hypothetical protein
MADEAHETSNPVPAHREPPPSLGMVAHIWGGHLGSLDGAPLDAGLDPDPDATADSSPSLDGGTIELPLPRHSRVKVE